MSGFLNITHGQLLSSKAFYIFTLIHITKVIAVQSYSSIGITRSAVNNTDLE